MDRIVSMYWRNVDRRIIDAQQAVFNHFGCRIEQQERTGMEHGVWMDEIMESLRRDDAVLFADIDCIPLNKGIIDTAFNKARDGHIFGCAQVSTHIDPTRVFVSACFLAISKWTWETLDRPSFQTDRNNDTAQRITDVALAAKEAWPVEMLYPSDCVMPRWQADGHPYGMGTWYGNNDVFHLFESRYNQMPEVFLDVAFYAMRDVKFGAQYRDSIKKSAFTFYGDVIEALKRGDEADSLAIR